MANLIVGSEMRMTSLQIAELVESRHDDVKRSIDRIANRGVIAYPPMADVQETGGNNRTYTTQVYVFSGEQGKRDSIIVVAQLSPEFTARLVDRWQELENATSFRIPSTLSEALQLAADQARKIEADKPKVQHYDVVVERSGLLNATQVGQKVGLSAVSLNKALLEMRVYNASVKRGRAFNQWFIDQGLGELKQVEGGYTQALFTLKGEAWVIEKMISEGVYSPKSRSVSCS